MGAAPRQIKNRAHVRLFTRRHAKHLVEGGDLVACYLAVGLCHLGAERDDRDREGDALTGNAMAVIGRAAFMIGRRVPMRQVLADPCEQMTKRPAKGQVAGSDENAVDDAHLASIYDIFNAQVDCGGSIGAVFPTRGTRRAVPSSPMV